MYSAKRILNAVSESNDNKKREIRPLYSSERCIEQHYVFSTICE